MGEPNRAFNNAGPGTAIGANRTQQYKWQLPVEVAVLVGHVIADDSPAKFFHAFGHAYAFLQLLFPGMPGR